MWLSNWPGFALFCLVTFKLGDLALSRLTCHHFGNSRFLNNRHTVYQARGTLDWVWEIYSLCLFLRVTRLHCILHESDNSLRLPLRSVRRICRNRRKGFTLLLLHLQRLGPKTKASGSAGRTFRSYLIDLSDLRFACYQNLFYAILSHLLIQNHNGGRIQVTVENERQEQGRCFFGRPKEQTKSSDPFVSRHNFQVSRMRKHF